MSLEVVGVVAGVVVVVVVVVVTRITENGMG
jgi:hypothetical protein